MSCDSCVTLCDSDKKLSYGYICMAKKSKISKELKILVKDAFDELQQERFIMNSEKAHCNDFEDETENEDETKVDDDPIMPWNPGPIIDLAGMNKEDLLVINKG